VKVYLAGPLFTQSQQDWLRKLKEDIEILTTSRNAPVNVIWPYDLITPSEIESLGNQARHEIFSRCKSHLDDADVLIALLDGPQVDDGTAWEIGYFYAKRRPGQKIMGIRTDFRQAGESEGAVVNAMIEMACDRVVRSREAVLESWAEWSQGISA
jgi:nucleoside 2-deoxyribosyltransferase